MKGERSRTATSKLSRKTYASVASLAAGEVSIARAPLSAASASASNTSAWSLREKALRSICIPYWYATKPPPVEPSVASLFDPSEKTWMSPSGTVGRKARKSFAAASFVRPCGPEILFIASSRDSRAAQGGYYRGFTNSVLRSASSDRAKRVFPCPLCVILRTLLNRGCCGSSRAVLTAKAWEMRLSSTSGGRKRDSLYRADA